MESDVLGDLGRHIVELLKAKPGDNLVVTLLDNGTVSIAVQPEQKAEH